jgi:hypothetical protein
MARVSYYTSQLHRVRDMAYMIFSHGLYQTDGLTLAFELPDRTRNVIKETKKRGKVLTVVMCVPLLNSVSFQKV